MNKNFDEIYRLYVGDVYRFLLKLTRNEDLSEEITQETMFKAFKNIDRYNGKCKLTVWLCQIAKNTYYDYCRKNKDNSPDDNSIYENSYILQIEDKEEYLNIHKILHTINEPYKEVFTLRTFGELSYKDIADIFGKTENWARIIYYRAKKQIIDKITESR